MSKPPRRSKRVPIVVILCIVLLVVPLVATAADGFALNTVSGPDEVRQDEMLTVRVTVENEELGAATKPVHLWLDLNDNDRQDDDEPSKTVSPTLDPIETRTLLVSVSTEGLESGPLTYRVTSGDESVERTVTVLGPAVSADAGPSRTVRPGETITLDGSESNDADGSSLTYIWTHRSGPVGELSGASTARPTLTAPLVDRPSTIVYELTVLDDDGNRDTDNASIDVRPADAGIEAERRFDDEKAVPDRTVTTTLSVTFDEAHDSVSVLDEYRGSIADARLVSVTSDGASLESNVVFESVRTDTLTVALDDVPSGTLEVTYALTVDADATEGTLIEWTGSDRPDVTAGTVRTEFGTDAMSVESGTGPGPVTKADADDDGSISDEELFDAITDWASGRYDDDELNRIVIAWSTS